MAVDASGRERALSGPWAKQMRLMIREGYWGPIKRRIWAQRLGRGSYPVLAQ